MSSILSAKLCSNGHHTVPHLMGHDDGIVACHHNMNWRALEAKFRKCACHYWYKVIELALRQRCSASSLAETGMKSA